MHNLIKKSTFVLTLCFSLLAFSKVSHAAELEAANDLTELAKLMQEKDMPLLLAVEADYCNYCQRLKAEHLEPMVNNKDYTSRVLIRTLDLSGTNQILDLDGKATTPSELAKRYQAYLTPTLLFLNANGEEVADRMLGYNTPDFYGFYLDKAITTATNKMKMNEKNTNITAKNN